MRGESVTLFDMVDPEGNASSGLESFTGGLSAETVEPLNEVRQLEPVYPLTHALLGKKRPGQTHAPAPIVAEA